MSISQPEIHDDLPTLNTSATAASCSAQMPESLSVPLEDISEICSLPKQCIEGIWQKASQLVTMENAVVFLPGPTTKDRLVLASPLLYPIMFQSV